MTWNYRIIRKTGTDGEGYYIHEVYYNSKGEISLMTEEPVSPFGESHEELIRDLENMLEDTRQMPVLELDKTIFATMDE